MSSGGPPETTIDYSGRAGADNSHLVPPAQGAVSPPAAKPGTPGKDDGKQCGTPAGPGVGGTTGLTGAPGTGGGNGTPGGTITIQSGTISGHFTLTTNGGTGGNASNGGLGGPGQDGGPGGSSSSNCSGGPKGPGGQGGPGGPGGKAGNGGNAGSIYVTYTKVGDPPPTFTGTANAGVQGSPGAPGGGGPGGNGGAGGTGVVGDKAPPSIDGSPGKVFINGSVIG